MVAKEYGLTPKEFLEFTPKQLQMTIESLKVRLHNENAFRLKLHNFKAEYKNTEADKMMRSIERQRQQDDKKEQINAREFEKYGKQ